MRRIRDKVSGRSGHKMTLDAGDGRMVEGAPPNYASPRCARRAQMRVNQLPVPPTP
jgi:hypothetical protein